MGRLRPIEPLTEPLTDGVVTVRFRCESDLLAIGAASHDPETRRWLDDTPMDEAARSTSMFRVEEAWRTGQATPLVIADATTEEPTGIINLQFRNDDVATIAYSVFPAHRGRGIAPRAVQLVAKWAFSELGLSQILLEAAAENTASVRVAEKCQFQRIDSRASSAEGQHTMIVFACTKN
ncbi:GNAT family N-acetyltransferase [Streptomyces milbemycinicus]|uniref:GNAT family N-acetyltransferase n=1 Tax=Streptomyces milbemycinicus TaxID=476552 RepID=A0ABW8LDU3_9ACTN